MSLASERSNLRLRHESPRGLFAGERLEQYGAGRTCSANGCDARLSRYNPAKTCAVHRGWTATRARRHD
jgi:hypothetical protein